MAKESVNILKDKIDIVDLLAQLNAALSEEWLAFYQYWVGSFVVEGAMRGDVQREFQEHAAEEYPALASKFSLSNWHCGPTYFQVPIIEDEVVALSPTTAFATPVNIDFKS